MSSTSNKLNTLILYFTAFVMGFCGLSYEYTFSKLSANLLGNSNRQWALVIGVMMLFMGIGSHVQKQIKDKNLLLVFTLFEIILSVCGGLGIIFLFWIFGIDRNLYIVLQYSLIALIGFCVGVEIPVLIRLNETFQKKLKNNLSVIFRMDYLGAFIGALIWALVFITYITSISQMAILLSIINSVAILILFVRFSNSHTVYQKYRKHQLKIIALILSLIVALLVAWFFIPKIEFYLEQNLYKDKVIYRKTTPYQHIILTKHQKKGYISCYINNQLQFSTYDEHIYHEFLVHPALSLVPKAKNILVLGGGDGLAVREVLKYPQVEKITLVDLDPEMTRLAKENKYFTKINQNSLKNSKVLFLNNHKKNKSQPASKETLKSFSLTDRSTLPYQNSEYKVVVEEYHLDALVYLEHLRKITLNPDTLSSEESIQKPIKKPLLFDVIILDFPDPNSIELSKLYSLSFYQLLKQYLNKDGVIAQQSTSPLLAKKAFLCIGKTMEKAGLSTIPYRQNIPTFGEWGWWIATHKDIYSKNNEDRFLKKLNSLTIPKEVKRKYIHDKLFESALVFGKDFFEAKKKLKINTRLNNIIFHYYLEASSDW